MDRCKKHKEVAVITCEACMKAFVKHMDFQWVKSDKVEEVKLDG